jgi:hypothetical protein
MAEICEQGPVVGSPDDVLPEMNIPVPSGPLEHW